MLVLGVDVIVLCLISIACVAVLTMFCKFAGVTMDFGDGMVIGSAITGLVMVIGYVVMARVLDRIVLMM